MVILSWVYPIVAPFDTSLYNFKSLFNYWGTYNTPLRFPVSPPLIFMFTKTFSSHFIFWPFPTVIFISHFSTYVMSFFLYIVCNDAPLSPRHYSRYSSLYYSETSLHNLDPKKRSLTSSSLSFFLSQKSTALCHIFPQFLHFQLNREFILFLLSFLFSFALLQFPQQSDALWPYFPHLLHLHLKNLTFLFWFFSAYFNAITFYSSSVFIVFYFR